MVVFGACVAAASCPNDCNGHGRCMSMRYISYGAGAGACGAAPLDAFGPIAHTRVLVVFTSVGSEYLLMHLCVWMCMFVRLCICACICVFVWVFPENAPGQRSVLPTARTSPVARTPTGTWTGCSAACAIPGSSQATAVKVRAGPAGVMTTATARAGGLPGLAQLVVLSVLCGCGCGRTCLCTCVPGL